VNSSSFNRAMANGVLLLSAMLLGGCEGLVVHDVSSLLVPELPGDLGPPPLQSICVDGMPHFLGVRARTFGAGEMARRRGPFRKSQRIRGFQL